MASLTIPNATDHTGKSAEVHQGDEDLKGLTTKLAHLRIEAPSTPSLAYRAALLPRRLAVIDITYIILLRLMVAIYARVFSQPQFAKSTLQTLGQRNRESEKEAMQRKLKEKKITRDFCNITGQYVNAVIPPIIASKLSAVVPGLESWGTFKLGYLFRYAKYQVDMRTGCRAAFIESAWGKTLATVNRGLNTRLAAIFTHKAVLDFWVDFEHTFMRLCMKAEGDASSEELQSKNQMAKALDSLAQSLSQQAEIDAYIKTLKVESPEEALIARLEFCCAKKTLPPGVPDPSKEELKRETINARMDETLYDFIRGLMEKVLTHQSPENLKKWNLLGLLYWLEGKKILGEILTFLAAEYGIKQLVDPYLFTLAILNSQGVETFEMEPDGFGPDTAEKIVSTGKKIIEESLKPEAKSDAIRSHFEKSGLRAAPGNVKKILMKAKAKELLKRHISMLIHSFKGDKSRSPSSTLKTAREKASRLPVIGLAILSLHVLVNGSMFCMNYFLRNKEEDDSNFFDWMGKHFIGKNFCDFLADQIVEKIIYHPSWRLTLLHLIATLVNSVTNPEPTLSVPQVDKTKENFTKITSFLFDQLTSDTTFSGKIGDWAKHFTGEGAFGVFQQLMKPAAGSFLEKGLAPLLPTMKELLLFTRLTESYRWQFVTFEQEGADAKFWECYVREYLNREVHRRNPAPSDRIAVREEVVDTLLALDPVALRHRLAAMPPAPVKDELDDMHFVHLRKSTN